MLPQINQNIYWLSNKGKFFSDVLIGIEYLDTIKYQKVYKLKVKYNKFDKTNYAKCKHSYNEIIVKESSNPNNNYFLGYTLKKEDSPIILSTNLKEILLLRKIY